MTKCELRWPAPPRLEQQRTSHQLFFRDQEITRDQQKAFVRRFGFLHIHPFKQPLKEEGT
jgi:alpha-ketoglutarate-dependent taurine dioxygenase